MPLVAGSCDARSCTRRFASCTSSLTRSSPPLCVPDSLSAPAASADAISPARAPPIPSAIANSGGRTTNASSFWRRLRPGSVAKAWRPSLSPAPSPLISACPFPCRLRRAYVSCLEPQVGLADAHDVARREAALACEPDAVHERPVRRADVLQPDAVSAGLDARMSSGCVLVLGQRYVV